MLEAVTIIIVAHNAEGFIERALTSALAQQGVCILVVNDHSSDDTEGVVRSIAGDNAFVVVPEKHLGVGNARFTGLKHVKTPYVAWLDADDAYLPDRIPKMLKFLQERNLDVVYDSATLYSGKDACFIKDLNIPDFLKQGNDLSYRLLERCYVPGPGWMLMKTDIAQLVGFDKNFTHAEDFDFMVRLIMSGTKIGFMHYAGYMQYAYEGSLSRSIEKQKYFSGRALSKHTCGAYEQVYLGRGATPSIAFLAMLYIALYQGDYGAAWTYLDKLEKVCVDMDSVVEVNGPFNRKLGWYYNFFKGNLSHLSGHYIEAQNNFLEAKRYGYFAEIFNNLGVNYRKLDKFSSLSKDCFREALRIYPQCYDAIKNLNDGDSCLLTTHPLRTNPFRDSYISQKDFVLA